MPSSPLSKPVLFGLGSNVGDCLANLETAIQRLEVDFGPLRRSSVYRTPPWGDVNQPAFLNAVVRGTTTLAPAAVLERALMIEAALGRVRKRRWGPRVIDVDLLAYGDLVLDTLSLTLPHPRLQDRAFVVVPLAEVAPDWTHPILHATTAELLARLPSAEIAQVVRLT